MNESGKPRKYRSTTCLQSRLSNVDVVWRMKSNSLGTRKDTSGYGSGTGRTNRVISGLFRGRSETPRSTEKSRTYANHRATGITHQARGGHVTPPASSGCLLSPPDAKTPESSRKSCSIPESSVLSSLPSTYASHSIGSTFLCSAAISLESKQMNHNSSCISSLVNSRLSL